MIAAGARVANCEHNIARYLAFHVHIELLDFSKLEVRRLIEKCSGKRRKVRWSGVNRKCVNASPSNGVSVRYGSAVRSRGRTSHGRGCKGYSRLLGKAKEIALGEEGRILPQSLRAHTPGGIVINCIAGPEHGLVAAEHLPSHADSWLKGCPILLYSGRLRDTVLTGNEKLVGNNIVVRHPSIDFRDGIRNVPCQAKIHGQVFGYPPIILEERPVDFPPTASHRAVKRLIVLRHPGEAKQKIRFRVSVNTYTTARIACEIADGAGDPESILEGFGADIHLICADTDAEMDVVLPANHVDRIVDG